MRIFGIMIISVWLSACTSTPMFPPETMKDVEANTFDIKAWEKEAYRPSSAKFVPHQVELAGEIIRVIRKPEGIVIVAEEQPIAAPPTSNQTTVGQDGPFWFAITFKGSVEPRMLQTGNRLIAVGTTRQARAEMLGGAPRVLPHLRAQCLHIWNIEGAKNKYYYSEDFLEPYLTEERTYCRERRTAGSSSGAGEDDTAKMPAGDP